LHIHAFSSRFEIGFELHRRPGHSNALVLWRPPGGAIPDLLRKLKNDEKVGEEASGAVDAGSDDVLSDIDAFPESKYDVLPSDTLVMADDDCEVFDDEMEL